MPDFKYEVAFSFLDRDKELALVVKDALAGLTAFVYTERSEEITGGNGVNIYSSVFSRDARVVVVLFRKGWGETDWTAVEETAITTHGLKLRWETVLVVRLDDHRLPAWVPETSIYADFEKFGVTGLAAVVRSMVIRTGGVAREESIEERIARAADEARRIEERRSFLNSDNGIRAARNEWVELSKAITQIMTTMASTEGAPDLKYVPDPNIAGQWVDHYEVIRSRYGSIEFRWHCPASNTLSGSQLSIEHHDGFIARERTIVQSRTPKSFGEEVYRFEIDSSGTYGWRGKLDGRFHTSAGLARMHVDRLLDRITQRLRDIPVFPGEVR